MKTNDMMLVIYLSSLIRSVIALHNLINNKVRLSPSLCIYILIEWIRFLDFVCLSLDDGMFQLLNKEHEKAEDSKPVAIPATAGAS